jgi:hypothetical protein
MTLKPNKFRYHLRHPTDLLERVSIAAVERHVTIVAMSEIMAFHVNHPHATGVPRFVGHDQTCETITFFPIPDREYECEVHGFRRVKH